jgi:hypothetical protein
MLGTDRRPGAVDVEAGVLVVVHQPVGDPDRLRLGQVVGGDVRFECALQAAARLDGVGDCGGRPRRGRAS